MQTDLMSDEIPDNVVYIEDQRTKNMPVVNIDMEEMFKVFQDFVNKCSNSGTKEFSGLFPVGNYTVQVDVKFLEKK